MTKLGRTLSLLHAFHLWSLVGCVVQITTGAAIAASFGAHPGVGALAVVVAIALQVVNMYLAVRKWPNNHPFLNVALEYDPAAGPYLIHSSVTEHINGEATKRQGNP